MDIKGMESICNYILLLTSEIFGTMGERSPGQLDMEKREDLVKPSVRDSYCLMPPDVS